MISPFDHPYTVPPTLPVRLAAQPTGEHEHLSRRVLYEHDPQLSAAELAWSDLSALPRASRLRAGTGDALTHGADSDGAALKLSTTKEIPMKRTPLRRRVPLRAAKPI